MEEEEDFAVIDFCDECVYALLDLSMYLSISALELITIYV